MLDNLPALSHPTAYVGLYVYDFGSRVSVGYTPGEVGMLRKSPLHERGTAYEIYRASDDGTVELRGMSDARLLGMEAIYFGQSDAAQARGDYDELRRLAEQYPVPALVELQLSKIYSFNPPHVTSLTYPASASCVVGSWLAAGGFDGGNAVEMGIAAHLALKAASAMRLCSCVLPGHFDYHDRPAEEVLRTVGEVFQRTLLHRTIRP